MPGLEVTKSADPVADIFIRRDTIGHNDIPWTDFDIDTLRERVDRDSVDLSALRGEAVVLREVVKDNVPISVVQSYYDGDVEDLPVLPPRQRDTSPSLLRELL